MIWSIERVSQTICKVFIYLAIERPVEPFCEKIKKERER
jgi:hypothetical protein